MVNGSEAVTHLNGEFDLVKDYGQYASLPEACIEMKSVGVTHLSEMFILGQFKHELHVTERLHQRHNCQVAVGSELQYLRDLIFCIAVLGGERFQVSWVGECVFPLCIEWHIKPLGL